MANNNFKVYSPTKYKKPSPASSSKAKSLEQLLEEARQFKTLKESRITQATDLQDYQTNISNVQVEDTATQEEKKKASFGKKVGDTVKDVGGSLGVGATGALENIEDAQINARMTGLGFWDKVRAGFYDIIGQEQKANMIRTNTGIMQGIADIEDARTDYGQQKVYDWREKHSEDSALGETGRQVFESVGGMLPAIAISIPTGGAGAMTTIGFSSFGGASEQALEEGASYGEASAYGALSAAMELTTEKLVGGGLGKIIKVPGFLDNVIGKVTKTAVGRFAANALGEGLEEVLSELADPLFKTITYDKDAVKDYGTKEYWGRVLESGIVGTLSGAIFETSNIVINKAIKAETREIIQSYENINGLMQAEIQDGTMTAEKQLQFDKTLTELESQMQLKLDKMPLNKKIELVSKFGDSTTLFDNYDFTNSIVKSRETIKTIQETQKANTSEKTVEKGEDIASLPKTEETKSKVENIEPTQEQVKLEVETKVIEEAKETKTELTRKEGEIKESKHLETVKEAGKEYFNPELNDMLEMEKLTYTEVKNKDTAEQAKTELKGTRIETQVEKTINEINSNKKEINEVTVAKAHLLIQEANRKGMYQHAVDLTLALSDKLTKLGRTIQAASLIQRLSPEGQLMVFRKQQHKKNTEKSTKQLDKLHKSKAFQKVVAERTEQWFNKDLRLLKKKAIERVVENNPDVKLSKEQQTRLRNLTTTSQNYKTNMKKVFLEATNNNDTLSTQIANELSTEIKKLEVDLKDDYDNSVVIVPNVLVEQLINSKTPEATQEVARSIDKAMSIQRTATLFEKAMQWRYLAMLGNPKTHVRNVVSNVAFKEIVNFRNFVSRSVQSAFIKDKSKRTRTFKKTDATTQIYANEIATKTIKDMGEQSFKYIEANKGKVFNPKVIEAFRKFNYTMLKVEDNVFVQDRISRELGEWMTAKNITVEQAKADPKLIEPGIEFATEQGLKATFNDTSTLATVLTNLKAKSKVAEVSLGAVVPFVKTPINIARRAIEYSPVGLVKNLTYDIKQLKQGNITAGQFVDKISEGMTGTMITALGFFLAKMGILSGGSDEKYKVANYEKSIGEQPYSIKIGDKTYTLDWLAPSAMPLFTGVTMYEEFTELFGESKDEEETQRDALAFIGGFTHLLDPITEMSFMQSFNNVLNSYDSNKLVGVFEQSLESYIAQYFPTLGSQIAKTFDPTRRTTTATGQGYSKKVEQVRRYLQSKIPGMASFLEPYVNVWGEEEANPHFEDRLLENTVYPYWISHNKLTSVDTEIMRLYQQYGNASVMPGIPSSYYTIDGNRIDLTEEQYTEFKKQAGKFSFNNLQSLFPTNFYKNLTDEEKEKAISKVYSYAREYAKNTSNKEYLVSKSLGSSSNMFAYYNIYLANIEGVKDNEGNTIYDSKKQATLNFINSQKNLNIAQKRILTALAGYSNDTNKTETYNYIMSLKDLTEEEKQILFEFCKFK